MSKVMLDMPDVRLEAIAGKCGLERVFECCGFADVSNPVEDESGIGAVPENERHPPQVIHFRIAIDGNEVDVGETRAGLGQAVFNRLSRKSRPVLDPPEPLFFDCGYQLSVTNQDGGDIPMVGIDP